MQTRARSNPRAAVRRGGALGQAHLGFSGLRVSGIVAGYRQQHLPRLSTMRTKGGFLFSGPRILKARGRGAQDEAFAPRSLAQQSDCRHSLDPNLIPETGFFADWKSLPCSHP